MAYLGAYTYIAGKPSSRWSNQFLSLRMGPFGPIPGTVHGISQHMPIPSSLSALLLLAWSLASSATFASSPPSFSSPQLHFALPQRISQILSPLNKKNTNNIIFIYTHLSNYILLRMFLSSNSSWVGRILNLLQVKYICFSFSFFKKNHAFSQRKFLSRITKYVTPSSSAAGTIHNLAHFPVISVSFHSTKHKWITLQLHHLVSPSLVFQPLFPVPIPCSVTVTATHILPRLSMFIAINSSHVLEGSILLFILKFTEQPLFKQML